MMTRGGEIREVGRIARGLGDKETDVQVRAIVDTSFSDDQHHITRLKAELISSADSSRELADRNIRGTITCTQFIGPVYTKTQSNGYHVVCLEPWPDSPQTCAVVPPSELPLMRDLIAEVFSERMKGPLLIDTLTNKDGLNQESGTRAK